jgi:hypothetical protein
LIAAGRAHSIAVLADVTAPVLTVPNDVFVDGTSVEGALVAFEVTAVDDQDPNPGIVCQPPSGSLFPLLGTTVTCTATDRAGNSSTATFNVIVKDAFWQLQDLTGLVGSLGLGKLGSSLIDKLNTASRFIQAGKVSQACSTLDSFLNQVSAQVGKGLTVTQADELTARAVRIRNVCGC